LRSSAAAEAIQYSRSAKAIQSFVILAPCFWITTSAMPPRNDGGKISRLCEAAQLLKQSSATVQRSKSSSFVTTAILDHHSLARLRDDGWFVVIATLDRHVALLLAMTVEKYPVFAKQRSC